MSSLAQKLHGARNNSHPDLGNRPKRSERHSPTACPPKPNEARRAKMGHPGAARRSHPGVVAAQSGAPTEIRTRIIDLGNRKNIS